MKKAKKLMAKLMVMALVLAYIPAPAANVSAASNKVSTKMYTLSQKAGTYTAAFKLTIKAKKGYKIYYSTGSNLNIKKVIKSGKKKTIKISKTTTLKIYAVKKSTTITKKKLKTSAVKKKTKSYKYVIDTTGSTTSESTTTTDTTSSNSTTATTAATTTSSVDTGSTSGGTSSETSTAADSGSQSSSSDETTTPGSNQSGNDSDTPPTPPSGDQPGNDSDAPTPPSGDQPGNGNNTGGNNSSSDTKSQEDAQSEISTADENASAATSTEAAAGTESATTDSSESNSSEDSSDTETTSVSLSELTTDISSSYSSLSYKKAKMSTGEDGTTTVTSAAKLTITGGGNYTLTGDDTDTIENLVIKVEHDASEDTEATDTSEAYTKTDDDITITLDNVTIDNSALTSDDSVIGIKKTFTGNVTIILKGDSTIKGPSAFPSTTADAEPAALISFKNADKVLTVKSDSEETGTLTLIDSMPDDTTYIGIATVENSDGSETTEETNVDPADGIQAKGTLVIESGTININVNGDCLKGTGSGTYKEVQTTGDDGTVTLTNTRNYKSGGVTVKDGTLNLTSDLGKGISSKSGLVTIAGGTITINSADHAISAKNYTAQITGGTVNIGTENCGGDGIKAGDTVRITSGNVTIDNCYGDGIQAENVVIADGTLNIKTYYEYANTNFYASNNISSSYNSESENDSTGLKSETINYDTGSHKAIKAGTKEKTFSYTNIADSDDCDYEAGTTYYQAAAGGLTITGGTITLDTTNSGIKYNGGSSSGGAPGAGGMSVGDSKTIIGSPDDAIHSNNDATISGGTITINSSDDGVSVVNNLYILNDASVDVQTAYEGIEGSNIVIGTTNTSVSPTVIVYTNDDGINAAKKEKVTYVYADENETTYTKTSYKTSGNALTVNAGNVTVKIADDKTHQVSLSNKGESSKTYSFSADGDGIDCNGSFYAYGGNILVVGGTSGGNGSIDRDDNFIIGSGVTLFAIGSNGMVEGVTQADQAYVESSSASVSSGNTVTISDGSDTLYSYTANKTAGYILFSSPDLTSGSSYTLTTGSNTISLTATTAASSSGGMGGGGTPPNMPGGQNNQGGPGQNNQGGFNR